VIVNALAAPTCKHCILVRWHSWWCQIEVYEPHKQYILLQSIMINIFPTVNDTIMLKATSVYEMCGDCASD
jgi:hypothetical protein